MSPLTRTARHGLVPNQCDRDIDAVLIQRVTVRRIERQPEAEM